MSSGASWRGTGPKKVRAGWWFWYPFLFGIFFTVGGILSLAGSSVAGEGASGLITTTVVFLVLGVGSLLVAWWSWRDIHSADPEPELPGELSDAADADLDTNGVVGHATVSDFSYVAGTSSRDGTMLVNLVLDIATVGLGSRQVRHQARIPRSQTERLTKGATMPVTVSPTNPGAIRVDWTGLVPAL